MTFRSLLVTMLVGAAHRGHFAGPSSASSLTWSSSGFAGDCDGLFEGEPATLVLNWAGPLPPQQTPPPPVALPQPEP